MPGRAQYEFVQQGEIGIAFVQTASGVRVLSTKPGSQAHQLGVPVVCTTVAEEGECS